MMVNSIPAIGMLDSGAAISLVSEKLTSKVQCSGVPILPSHNWKVVGAQDLEIQIAGHIQLQLKMGNIDVNSRFLVAKGIVSDIIVGNNIIDSLSLNINFKQHKAFMDSRGAFTFDCCTLLTVVLAVAMVDVLVPPMCKLRLSLTTPDMVREVLITPLAALLRSSLIIMDIVDNSLVEECK
jgi:hypothetical protein